MKIYIVVGVTECYSELEYENLRAFSKEFDAQKYVEKNKEKYDDLYIENFIVE